MISILVSLGALIKAKYSIGPSGTEIGPSKSSAPKDSNLWISDFNE